MVHPEQETAAAAELNEAVSRARTTTTSTTTYGIVAANEKQFDSHDATRRILMELEQNHDEEL